jgi:hypothetical protein
LRKVEPKYPPLRKVEPKHPPLRKVEPKYPPLRKVKKVVFIEINLKTSQHMKI